MPVRWFPKVSRIRSVPDPVLHSASYFTVSSPVGISIHMSTTPRVPSFRISMALQAPDKNPGASSFLDRRESGVLHFVDNRESSEPIITPEQAVKLCDRNFGIGTDGVIIAMAGINGTDYTMRIFNSDGSEPEIYSTHWCWLNCS
ncbi:hypothetical protein SAY86_029982 [Trapa natans]|uniref:Uncharacterized protein n=1 Tax=Trapa natans TaxID=22666 RepID=A0AAN7RGP4_TRANT|nr:hypothetical protein SAY86_029982 [Trapa natans]